MNGAVDSPNILTFWGKAQGLSADSPDWHPLVFHSLDVAAVADAMLVANGSYIANYFARHLGSPLEDILDLVRFLVAIHDVGKFSRQFQAKSRNHFPKDWFSENTIDIPTTYDHATGGYDLFDHGLLQYPLGLNANQHKYLIAAVTGHHGRPPSISATENSVSIKQEFGPRGIDAARCFIELVLDLFGLRQRDLDLRGKTKTIKSVSFALAGFSVQCDWIGSNRSWFRYVNPHEFADLNTYWRYAQVQATRAIEEAGVVPANLKSSLEYRDILQSNHVIPKPMQIWAKTCEIPQMPSLYLIEDETGSGKTEVALMLAFRLMNAALGHGIYVALPTMATSNAMFDRLNYSYGALYEKSRVPSLILVHGKSHLRAQYRDLNFGSSTESPYSSETDGPLEKDYDDTATNSCTEWLSDDRRKAFLSDIAVGTVDQAIMAILPFRFQSLRLWGLAHRILIVDEIHAYDKYVQRELEQLLRFQGSLGGSAILMSASLSASVKEQLINSYEQGIGIKRTFETREDGQSPYPAVTLTNEKGRNLKPVRSYARKRVSVKFLHSIDEAYECIKKSAERGHATLYIRNTVGNVLDAAEALSPELSDVTVFHSRFTLSDRLQIERLVTSKWGKYSSAEQRSGTLIASQVVEQSLDLDFDVIVTDLAPIDLLIQRAGRLWRHPKEHRSGTPELTVVSPPATHDASENWYKSMFPEAAYVYTDHARLWLTTNVLEKMGEIMSPDSIRELIEEVYGDDSEEHVPQKLQASLYETEGNEGAARGIASANVLNPSTGYMHDGGRWMPEEHFSTRIGDDPQTELRLGIIENGALVPIANSAGSVYDRKTAWSLSEVRVSQRKVPVTSVQPQYAKMAEEERKCHSWTRYDEGKVLVIMSHEADGWLSATLETDDTCRKQIKLRYGRDHGLIVN